MIKTQKSINLNGGIFEQSNQINFDDFMNLQIVDLIAQHHRRKADTSIFFTDGTDLKEKDKYMFIISQDISFVSENKMLTPNPEKTLDLFNQINQQNIVSLKQLNNQMENNQTDYELQIDNNSYSFRLIKGIKVKNFLEKFNTYSEEIFNINEYKNKLKI